jgi:hypothetical protein
LEIVEGNVVIVGGSIKSASKARPIELSIGLTESALPPLFLKALHIGKGQRLFFE